MEEYEEKGMLCDGQTAKETFHLPESVGPRKDTLEHLREALAKEPPRLARKIDMIVLPVLCLVFFVQYLDKQSLGYAAVFGLKADLHMTPSQYSWTNSIFAIGQFVSEYLFIYLMSRLPLARLVGVSIMVWGGVCMALAAPSSFAGFSAVRFLLGFAEGAVYPAFVTITSIWYTRDRHATRVGVWVSMNGLAQVIGPLIMYGVGKHTDITLAPWRVMFLICGGLSVAMGGIFLAIIPINPAEAWFFTTEEREFIAERMRRDLEGGDKSTFSLEQFLEAMRDPKAWLMLLFGILLTMVSPVLIFASLVISGLGYDRFDTMLYTAPSGAVQILLIWVGVAGCSLFPRHRIAVCCALIIVPLTGSVLLLKLDVSSGWALIAASWLASCISAVMSIILSISASNVKGNTKRATVNSMFFIGYCVGAVAGVQIWVKPPRYAAGVITTIALWIVLILALCLYLFLCYADNKSRDKGRGSANETKRGSNDDLTDKQDIHFSVSSCDSLQNKARSRESPGS